MCLLFLFYAVLGYAQKLQFSNSKKYNYDEAPFFARGIYQLDKISIVPDLAKEDSLLLAQSTECLSLMHYFINRIPDSLIFVEMTVDSIKFLDGYCASKDFKGFFESKFVKSFSTTHNKEKLGYFIANMNSVDKNGTLVPSVFRFPQYVLEFRERIISKSNVYSVNGIFKMIKYRHIDDNSLRPILKRIE